jgi:hypothetical protein
VPELDDHHWVITTQNLTIDSAKNVGYATTAKQSGGLAREVIFGKFREFLLLYALDSGGVQFLELFFVRPTTSQQVNMTVSPG